MESVTHRQEAPPPEARAIERDRHDLETLYREHAPSVHRLAYLITGDRETAADIVQEAFVRILARFGHLRDVERFGFYLRRTVVNIANRHFRRLTLERRTPQPRPVTEGGDMTQEIADAHDLWARLLTLPPRQRAALVLRYYDDLTEVDVGEVLGISRRAASSLISRGLAALRRQEEDRDG